MPRKLTLLAASGMSPAVITETVWALASEDPPVIPGSVIAVTSRSGKRRIEEALFQKREDFRGRTVWQALREDVGKLLGRRLADDELQFAPLPEFVRTITATG